MAIRFPLRAQLPSMGQAPTSMVGVGYMRGTEELSFPAMPFLVLAAATQTSDPIMAAGFDNFMLIADFSGVGGTATFEYLILEPNTLAVLATRTISAAVAPATGVVLTFGAASASAAASTRGDTWILFQIRLTANVADQTFSAIRLWLGVR